MSSYNRKISAKNVRVTEHSKVLNDKFFVEEEKFEEVYIEEKKKNIQEKVKQLESKMIQEVAEKKQKIMDEAYESGKQRAVQEAEEKIRNEIQNILQEANNILEDANQYRKRIISEAELIKEQTYKEQKEEILEFISQMVGKVIKNEVKVEQMNLDEMYEDVLKKITYETKKIYIRVHPLLREWIDNNEGATHDGRIEYFYDLNIQPGDLFVETDKEYIDASIQQKISQLREKMRGVINDSI